MFNIDTVKTIAEKTVFCNLENKNRYEVDSIVSNVLFQLVKPRGNDCYMPLFCGVSLFALLTASEKDEKQKAAYVGSMAKRQIIRYYRDIKYESGNDWKSGKPQICAASPCIVKDSSGKITNIVPAKEIKAGKDKKSFFEGLHHNQSGFNEFLTAEISGGPECGEEYSGLYAAQSFMRTLRDDTAARLVEIGNKRLAGLPLEGKEQDCIDRIRVKFSKWAARQVDN